MRSISGTQSRTYGSQVAIVTSFGVDADRQDAEARRVGRGHHVGDAATSTFSGSMRRYGRPTRLASHSVSVSSVSGLDGAPLLPLLVGDDRERMLRAAVVAPLLLQLRRRLGADQLVLDQPVEQLGERAGARSGGLWLLRCIRIEDYTANCAHRHAALRAAFEFHRAGAGCARSGRGHVRLRQLRLHHRRHHRGLQRVLRRASSPATRRGRRSRGPRRSRCPTRSSCSPARWSAPGPTRTRRRSGCCSFATVGCVALHRRARLRRPGRRGARHRADHRVATSSSAPART